MRSLRTLLLAVPLALLAVLAIGPPPADASALTLRHALPTPFRNADYSGHITPIAQATRHKLVKRSHLAVPANHSSAHGTPSKHEKHLVHTSKALATGKSKQPAPITASRRTRQDSTADMDVLLGQLGGQRDSMVSSSQALQQLAQQSASADPNDGTFQRNAATHLTTYYTASQETGGILAQMLPAVAGDRGVLYYDKSNQLEVILNDMNKANKDALKATYVLIENIPGLGPILGPTVYTIKCLIEDLLNSVNNLTDAVINALQPYLPDLLGSQKEAAGILCGSQLKLLGLCV